SGWDIDILTEAEESERRQEEVRSRSKLFIDVLDIDEVIAHLLVAEGFQTLEDVAFVPVEDLAEIEGFELEVANELRQRARDFITKRDEELEKKRKELGVTDEIAALEGMTPALLAAVGEKGIKTLDDFADLAGDELLEIVPKGSLTEDKANTMIMAARAHWFADETPAAGAETPKAE
ncbi:MAG: helix-hairpin-helix domain-containing protein, partial [Pseudomonadota bacterium]